MSPRRQLVVEAQALVEKSLELQPLPREERYELEQAKIALGLALQAGDEEMPEPEVFYHLRD